MRSSVDRGKEVVILAVDSGFATLGLAVLRGDPDKGVKGATLESLAFHKTVKSDKKSRRKIRVSTDDRTRLQAMLRVVLEAVDRVAPDVLVVEWYQPNMGQKARPNAGGWKAALCVGGIIGLGLAGRIPVMEQLPGDKKSLGAASGGKDDVESWLRSHLAGFAQAADRVARSNREHPTDAAGHAVLALRELAERRSEAAL